MIAFMILGLGTDLVEVERMAALLARHGNAFLSRVFSERECALLEVDRGAARVQRVAARFAAKEAALKALGCGWGQGVGWRDVEVLGGRGGPPTLELSGPAAARLASLGATRAHVSLTHTDRVAGATVLLD